MRLKHTIGSAVYGTAPTGKTYIRLMLNEEEFARVPEADRSDKLFLFKRKLGKKGFIVMAPVKLKVKTEGGE